MTRPHSTLHHGARAAVFGLVLLVPAHGGAAPGGRMDVGWSNAPRWRLPRERPPECPRGYAGGLVQVSKARCIGQGPKSQPDPEPPRPAREPPREEPPPRRPAPERPPPLVPEEPPPPRERPAARPPPPLAGGWPDATALMAMGPARCHDYLREHEVPFAALPAGEAPEVAIPVRLKGPVAGVTFTIPWSNDPERDHHAIWDCRLVAAFVPFARWLAARGITEVQYFSALRRGKIVRDKPRSQHNTGLALDLYALRQGGDAAATVEDHYPRRELRRCPAPGQAGPGAAPPAGAPMSDIYLALVCLAAERGLVHTLLTPDHDRAHANHLHLDLKPGQTSPVDPFISFHGL